MSKYYSGEELNDKMMDLMPSFFGCKYHQRDPKNQRQIDAFAEWAKIPKPAPPSPAAVFRQWQHDRGLCVDDLTVMDLAERLAANKAAHEEYDRE